MSSIEHLRTYKDFRIIVNERIRDYPPFAIKHMFLEWYISTKDGCMVRKGCLSQEYTERGVEWGFDQATGWIDWHLAKVKTFIKNTIVVIEHENARKG